MQQIQTFCYFSMGYFLILIWYMLPLTMLTTVSSMLEILIFNKKFTLLVIPLSMLSLIINVILEGFTNVTAEHSKHLNNALMLEKCWTGAADGGRTLFQHWLNVSCLHGQKRHNISQYVFVLTCGYRCECL